MSVKRPRIDPALAELIERVRGDVPFERFINNALSQHLATYRLDAKAAAKIAAKESGLNAEKRRRLYHKMSENAIEGRRPREGLTPAEERAFDIMGRYLPRSHDDAEVYRRLFWGV